MNDEWRTPIGPEEYETFKARYGDLTDPVVPERVARLIEEYLSIPHQQER